MGNNEYSSGLKTIDQDGTIPETRMVNAMDTRDYVVRLIQYDCDRAYARSLVDGLVDGNPPYSREKLRARKQSRNCNVNWGSGRAYLEAASGSFYDLVSQAPGFVSIETSYGDYQHRIDYSNIMSEVADLVCAVDPDWDIDIQNSQNEMVLHGNGPLMFEDEYKVFPRSMETGDMVIPDRASSKTGLWEFAGVRVDYSPPELYKFIRNEDAAHNRGWNVPFTQNVIANAMSANIPNTDTTYNWEWYQTQLKSKSFTYMDDSLICRLAHCFWREFDGKITHAIVQRDNTAASNKNKKAEETNVQYLFLKIGRYESYNQCLHPMYFDRGRGGYHHNVTGLGTKMYAGMEYENRLMCNGMNKVFSPKVFFSPASASAKEKLQITIFEDHGILPAGANMQQAPVSGQIDEVLSMLRVSGDLMRSNLSQYRQQVEPDRPGNPATKYEKQMQASQQSALSNTVFARFYKQWDAVYTEIVRRLCNLNTTDQRAKNFQKECEARGVPRECFGRVERVTAVRVVGSGSPFMRQQVIQQVGTVIGGCSEEGQQNWRNDYIAAHAGPQAAARWNPQRSQSPLPTDQMKDAWNEVVKMKNGLQTTVTASENPVTFCGIFMKAATDAINSIRQGADPRAVLSFVTLAGQGMHAHILRMQKDPLKKAAVNIFNQKLKQLGGLTDKIGRMVQAQDKQRKAQQGKTARVLNDLQLANLTTKSDIARKNAKARQQLMVNAARARQNLGEGQQRMALADANVASDIRRKHFASLAE